MKHLSSTYRKMKHLLFSLFRSMKHLLFSLCRSMKHLLSKINRQMKHLPTSVIYILDCVYPISQFSESNIYSLLKHCVYSIQRECFIFYFSYLNQSEYFIILVNIKTPCIWAQIYWLNHFLFSSLNHVSNVFKCRSYWFHTNKNKNMVHLGNTNFWEL